MDYDCFVGFPYRSAGLTPEAISTTANHMTPSLLTFAAPLLLMAPLLTHPASAGLLPSSRQAEPIVLRVDPSTARGTDDDSALVTDESDGDDHPERPSHGTSLSGRLGDGGHLMQPPHPTVSRTLHDRSAHDARLLLIHQPQLFPAPPHAPPSRANSSRP